MTEHYSDDPVALREVVRWHRREIRELPRKMGGPRLTELVTHHAQAAERILTRLREMGESDDVRTPEAWRD